MNPSHIHIFLKTFNKINNLEFNLYHFLVYKDNFLSKYINKHHYKSYLYCLVNFHKIPYPNLFICVKKLIFQKKLSSLNKLKS